jgi:5-methyltetrahydrofolate--homocysteine methyltransferase
MDHMSRIMNQIYASILAGNYTLVQDQVRQALAESLDPGTILNEGMIAAMKEIGERFEEGSCYIPDMLIAARAMQAGLEILKPALVLAKVKPLGRVVVGTIKGDIHDIGKNLVCMMLEGAGFEVIDLGVDVAPEEYLAAIQEHNPDLVGISALLTTTMQNMRVAVEAIHTTLPDKVVKVIVGGAPVTEDFARRIGADGYAADASKAVYLAKTLIR